MSNPVNSNFVVKHNERVAAGRYRPEAPTDPCVRTLPHTVPQVTLLRVCTLNER